jgi:membrane protease YdiL (CAAX protease family)
VSAGFAILAQDAGSTAVDADGLASASPRALLALGLLLVLAAVAVAPLVAHLARRVHPGRNIVFARHGFSHVAVVVLVVLAASALAAPLVERAGGGLLARLLGGAFGFACGVAYVVHSQVRLDPDSWRALGLRPGTNHGTALVVGLGSWLVFLPAFFGLGFAWLWAARTFELGDPAQPIAREFLALPAGGRWLPLVLGVAVVPLLEEILFRGFLQPLLVQNLREKAGVATCAIVFGALHGEAAFLQVTGLAIVLGAVMLRTQSLLAVWAIHAAHNGLMFWLMYNVPEVRRFMDA